MWPEPFFVLGFFSDYYYRRLGKLGRNLFGNTLLVINHRSKEI
jgi:hypothetical protein